MASKYKAMEYQGDAQQPILKPVNGHIFMLYLLVLAAPLYKLPLLNLGERDFRFDWLLMMFIVVSFYFESSIRGRIRIYNDSLFFWLMIFVVFLTLSLKSPILAGREKIINFFTTWSQYLLCISGFIIICHINMKTESMIKLIRFSIILAFLIAAFGIIQWLLSMVGIVIYLPSLSANYREYASGYENLLGGFRRAVSIFTEPRHFGNYLITPICILVLTKFSRPFNIFRDNVITNFVLATLGLGLMVSFSMSAYLNLVIALFLMIIIAGAGPGRIVKVSLVAVCGVFLFYIIAVTALDFDLFGYVARRLSIGKIDEFYDYETQIFGVLRYARGMFEAMRIAIANPILGIGLNQIYSLTDKEIFLVMPPFELLAAIGFFGFGSFLLFLYVFAKKISLLKKRLSADRVKETVLANVGLAYILVAFLKSLGASRYNYPSTLFWIELSIAGLIYFNIKKSSTED